MSPGIGAASAEQTKDIGQRAILIELVGPPGAGKTSLLTTWMRRRSDVRIQSCPYFRNAKDTPFFVRNFVSLLPTFSELYLHEGTRRLSRRDIALMTILAGWDRVLLAEAARNQGSIALDEGAICLLGRLYGFGSPLFRDAPTATWWNQTLQRWAGVLNVVVHLDAPTPDLVSRIRHRKRQYEMKEMSDAQVLEHLARIQDSLAYVLSSLRSYQPGPQILCFNTAEATPDQICDQLLDSQTQLLSAASVLA